MFVKVCGITRVEDARAALERGADAIGFVFWPKSPRFVDPARARAILAALAPPVISVGVFVNQSSDEINRIAELVGLSAVQLHGDETPQFAEALTRPAIKALSSIGGSLSAADWPRELAVLVDAHDPAQRGGTGTAADWPAAAVLARERRVLLAGGLTPENVAGAIATVHPFGVDVSSGVESSPGVKDARKIEAFIDAVAGVKI